MSNVHYHGKNGNPAIDREKVENLRLANEIQRAKLGRLSGELVSKREVQFTVGFALTALRENILRLPNLVSSELRGFDRAVVHSIRQRVDQRIRRSLEELAESLALAVSAEDFLDRMNGDAETDAAKAARDRKRDLANAKRREKYAARRKE